MVSLQLEGVGWREAVVNVTQTWESGRMIGLVGPNGAGKSTLLRLVAGVWRPTSGIVRWNGTPLHRLPPRERARRIAYLPQQVPDDTPYTVRQYVEMGRYAYGSPWTGYEGGGSGRAAVQRALERTGLQELADEPMNRLSGGQRQRAAIARCLAQGSPVLLLDEPIANLDLYYQTDILTQLQNLAQEGYLVVLAIHHLELAARYCTDVVMLQRGRIAGAGSPAAVLTPDTLLAVFGMGVRTYADPYTGALRLSLT
ncbi:MAG: ABC transporter ATP-binding protein [Alicyclobacillus sp.]|nr:ABC transporter ATP-binding protein [Alicyclobacillus sp.]